ncbi:MAG: hypothetical protein HY868_27115 [Chloroflexi bacterium]|nr:hypothetical protein [Chloroflexota bacterium]
MTRTILLMLVMLTMLTACDALPFGGNAATPPPNTLIYEAPVSLTVKKDSPLSGTAIGYQGKSDTGAARVTIAGQSAPKQVGDSVDWQGTPVPNVDLKLALRVLTFDDQSVTFAGTARIEIRNIAIQPGGSPGKAMLEFNAPVTFNLSKGETVLGSNVSYVGATPNGAQFAGVEGFPYRKTLDSIQYNGRISPKVYLRHDLRLIRFTDTDAVVGGTAKIIIEQ